MLRGSCNRELTGWIQVLLRYHVLEHYNSRAAASTFFLYLTTVSLTCSGTAASGSFSSPQKTPNHHATVRNSAAISTWLAIIAVLGENRIEINKQITEAVR